MQDRILNTVIRGISLLSKFVLIIFIAKYLTLSEVGVYGLIAGSSNYFLFALGFEFYTYSTREILGKSQDKWYEMLRDQLVFYACSYTIILPISSLLFIYNWLPESVALWFYILLPLEHIAQELNRLLIIMSRQLTASWILLLRNCGGTVSIILMFFFPALRTLETIFFCWSCSVFLACILGLKVLLTLNKNGIDKNINWKWICKGLKICIPLLIASLAIKSIFILDRYLVSALAGAEILGIYVLYIGLGNAVLNFLDSSVISFLYPKLIAVAKHEDKSKFNQYMTQLLINVIVTTILLIAIILVCSYPLLWWINQEIYVTHYRVLLYVLASVFFYSVNLVPQIGLYSHNNDAPVIGANIIGLTVFILASKFSNLESNVYIVPASMLLAFICMVSINSCSYYYHYYKSQLLSIS